MKAIVLHAYGPASSLRYEEVADPRPAMGEVLVRVVATSINPVDWMLRSGVIRNLIPIAFPTILGVDLAGTVEALGDGVTGFVPGDRVMALASRTYADLCTVKATDLVHIPDGLEMIAAAALPLVNLTGDQLVRLGAKAQQNEAVLVTGALGSVGRSAVFAAAQIGARVIAGVRTNRLDEARRLESVADVVAIDDPTAIDGLEELDSVADTVGGPTASKLLARVKRGGAYGCFPSTAHDVGERADVEINAVFAKPDTVTTLRYAEAVRDGGLSIPVDRIVPLADAAHAHALVERGGVAKIVLTP